MWKKKGKLGGGGGGGGGGGRCVHNGKGIGYMYGED